MCEFFSVVSDGKGNIWYFDWKVRKRILKEELDYEHDSHTSIASYFKLDEDRLNKYEYNPLTKELKVDQLNTRSDRNNVKTLCCDLFAFNSKKIIPQLVIKPIINPFELKPPKITDEHIALLKQWDSVWASVWASVWDSVWASVGDSVWASVGDSVGDSVWDSVWDSVRDSVRASVRDSVGAYIGSFFNLKRSEWQYTGKLPKIPKYPFEPCVKLWEQGLVPSFDGKVWRIHGGKDAKVLFEITKEKLKKGDSK